MGKNNCVGIIVLLLLPLLSAKANAQQSKSEFSIAAAGGISSLLYKIPEGKTNFILPGGSLSLNATFFIARNIGIRLGAGAYFYQGSTDMSGYYTEIPTIDEQNEELIFRYQLKKYKEHQSLLAINIPLMLHFRSNGSSGFYAALGAQLSLPLQINYSVSETSVKTTGYYPEHKVEIEQPAFMGIGTFNQSAYKERYGNLSVDINACLEFGWKFALNERMFLYVGIYGEYGLLKRYVGGIRENIEAPTAKASGTSGTYSTFGTSGAAAASGVNPFITHNKNEYGEHISIEYNPVFEAFNPHINSLSSGIKIAFAISGKNTYKKKIKAIPCPKDFERPRKKSIFD